MLAKAVSVGACKQDVLNAYMPCQTCAVVKDKTQYESKTERVYYIRSTSNTFEKKGGVGGGGGGGKRSTKIKQPLMR